MLKCQQTLREYLIERGDDGTVQALSQMLAQESKDTVIDSGDGKTRVVFNLAAPYKIESSSGVPSPIQNAPPTIQHFIIVINDENQKKKLFSEKNFIMKFVEKEMKKTIEFFDVSDLRFNVLKHYLVPKHEVVRNKPDVQAVLDAHGLRTSTHLPLILNSDPVARAIGARPGDLVKVTRFTKTAGEHIVYRSCVKVLSSDKH